MSGLSELDYSGFNKRKYNREYSRYKYNNDEEFKQRHKQQLSKKVECPKCHKQVRKLRLKNHLKTNLCKKNAKIYKKELVDNKEVIIDELEECKYCNKKMKKDNLNKHQKLSKMCLNIQDNLKIKETLKEITENIYHQIKKINNKIQISNDEERTPIEDEYIEIINGCKILDIK